MPNDNNTNKKLLADISDTSTSLLNSEEQHIANNKNMKEYDIKEVRRFVKLMIAGHKPG